jgi:hypothetical protein
MGAAIPGWGWLMMYAAARAEMPWLVLTLAAHCDKAAARECFQPLVPLLRRALDHMKWRLQAVPLGKKVHTALSQLGTMCNGCILTPVGMPIWHLARLGTMASTSSHT